MYIKIKLLIVIFEKGRKWRLFVGNLAETVKQDELREKFELLLRDKGGDSQDVKIGNTEIRCKNEDNYFGFVDVHSNSGGDDRPPSSLEKGFFTKLSFKFKYEKIIQCNINCFQLYS